MNPILLRAARAAAVAAALALTACETPVEKPAFPEITFQHLDPIRLDVAEVEYVRSYAPPMEAPNVEHLFPVKPSTVVRRWVDERIEAMGISRRARVTLVEASVVEVPLEIKTGVVGLFYEEPSERYDGTVEVLVEVVDDRGMVLGHARAVSEFSRSVSEDVSINEREQVWFEMTEAMMRALDSELERVIRRYVGKYVR